MNDTVGTIVNSTGAVAYLVLDLDAALDMMELLDPHTQEKFLLYNVATTLELLGYKLKEDD